MEDFDSGFDSGESFDVSDASTDISGVEIDMTNDITVDAQPHESLELDLGLADATEAPLDDFEQRIEELSLDELSTEREWLVELGALDGEQLAQQYDDFMAEQATQEQFDGLTEGLSAEQLEQMKSQLISGDQDMQDIWGLGKDLSEDEGDAKVLKR